MFKSKFEKEVSTFYGLNDAYEIEAIPYVIESKYNPDFKLAKNVFLETKGFFKDSDRRKILAVVKQHPDKKIIMFFQDSTVKLRKKGKMTYGEWCDKNGIDWFCWKTKRPTKRILSVAIKSSSN